MGIDEAGDDHMIARVDHHIGVWRQSICRANRLDQIAAHQHAGIAQLSARIVHRGDDAGVFDQQGAGIGG